MKYLKPIPQESRPRGTAMEITEETKKSLMEVIKQKLALKKVEQEEKILGKTCMRLIKFACSKDPMTLPEIEELLNNMERSVIFIQRKKKKILEKRNKKLNMVAIKKAKYGNSGDKHRSGKNKHSTNRKDFRR